ncbi:MAG: hypothetical protein ACR2KP_03315 [Egibacteraceae bacterium]
MVHGEAIRDAPGTEPQPDGSRRRSMPHQEKLGDIAYAARRADVERSTMAIRHGGTVDLLVSRAYGLSRHDVDRHLAAGELIRTARGDVVLLGRAQEDARQRWRSVGDVRTGEVVGLLAAAVRSLEEEQAAARLDEL